MSSISSFTNCGGVDDDDDSDDHDDNNDDDHDDVLDAGNKGKIVDIVMNTMVISTCTDDEDDGENDGEHDGEHDGGNDVEHDGGDDDVHDIGSHLHRVDLVLDGYHVTFHFTHISLARLNTGENNG